MYTRLQIPLPPGPHCLRSVTLIALMWPSCWAQCCHRSGGVCNHGKSAFDQIKPAVPLGICPLPLPLLISLAFGAVYNSDSRRCPSIHYQTTLVIVRTTRTLDYFLPPRLGLTPFYSGPPAPRPCFGHDFPASPTSRTLSDSRQVTLCEITCCAIPRPSLRLHRTTPISHHSSFGLLTGLPATLLPVAPDRSPS